MVDAHAANEKQERHKQESSQYNEDGEDGSRSALRCRRLIAEPGEYYIAASQRLLMEIVHEGSIGSEARLLQGLFAIIAKGR